MELTRLRCLSVAIPHRLELVEVLRLEFSREGGRCQTKDFIKFRSSLITKLYVALIDLSDQPLPNVLEALVFLVKSPLDYKRQDELLVSLVSQGLLLE